MSLAQIELNSNCDHTPQPPVEDQVKAWFLGTVGNLLPGGSSAPEDFLIYFAGRAPRDEEILALLAIATNLASSPLTALFPTAFEALASLPDAGRSDLCQAFRTALASCSRPHTAA